ncbi:hypothetical protein LTR05_005123 [Lithohypha guttulata]|uniref:Uncharacterized protein n=1 Tax=Lithohypha guttulata TaxID=1690604 RepID=A0AAN7T0C6_9EURO|nr:hypothetical protein LTR05_005123 [Lithohypha guttulata]
MDADFSGNDGELTAEARKNQKKRNKMTKQNGDAPTTKDIVDDDNKPTINPIVKVKLEPTSDGELSTSPQFDGEIKDENPDEKTSKKKKKKNRKNKKSHNKPSSPPTA